MFSSVLLNFTILKLAVSAGCFDFRAMAQTVHSKQGARRWVMGECGGRILNQSIAIVASSSRAPSNRRCESVSSRTLQRSVKKVDLTWVTSINVFYNNRKHNNSLGINIDYKLVKSVWFFIFFYLDLSRFSGENIHKCTVTFWGFLEYQKVHSPTGKYRITNFYESWLKLSLGWHDGDGTHMRWPPFANAERGKVSILYNMT